MRFEADAVYSGVAFVARNEVRRTVLFEHRRGAPFPDPHSPESFDDGLRVGDEGSSS